MERRESEMLMETQEQWMVDTQRITAFLDWLKEQNGTMWLEALGCAETIAGILATPCVIGSDHVSYPDYSAGEHAAMTLRDIAQQANFVEVAHYCERTRTYLVALRTAIEQVMQVMCGEQAKHE